MADQGRRREHHFSLFAKLAIHLSTKRKRSVSTKESQEEGTKQFDHKEEQRD